MGRPSRRDQAGWRECGGWQVTDIRSVLDTIKRDAGLTDPAQIALVSRVTVDFAQLQARAAAGEDVAEELKVVTATALNLSENVRNVMANQLAGWLSALLFKVLSA